MYNVSSVLVCTPKAHFGSFAIFFSRVSCSVMQIWTVLYFLIIRVWDNQGTMEVQENEEKKNK